MFDQPAGDAPAPRVRMGRKGRVGDMRPACGAVRAHMAGPQDAAVQHRDEGRKGMREPVSDRLGAGDVTGDAIGFSGTITGYESWPLIVES